MKLYIVIFIYLLISVNRIFAQDPHFSQYFNLPLSVNPAATGNFNNAASITANFRQQWRGVGLPYNTGYFNGEFRILKNKITNDNRLGVGIGGMYDESLGGGLKTNMLSTSTAYNINLGGYKSKNFLGIGIGGSYFNRRIDFTKIDFQQQFTSGGFDTNLPTGETGLQALKNVFDINAGISYTYTDDSWYINAGIGAFHINEPAQTALNDPNEKIKRRYSAHAISSFPLDFYKDLQLHALHSWQGNVRETIVGTGITWMLNNATDQEKAVELETLMFYRISEALYPYVGFIFSGMNIGLSYDVTVSSLASQALPNRSLELSLRYTFK